MEGFTFYISRQDGEKEGSPGQNTYSKGDSKLSLVNETKETNSEKIIPPSTKV